MENPDADPSSPLSRDPPWGTVRAVLVRFFIPAGLSLVACAPAGQLATLHKLPNNVAEPSRPAPPSRPPEPSLGAFPNVVTFASRSHGGGGAIQSDFTSSPVAVAHNGHHNGAEPAIHQEPTRSPPEPTPEPTRPVETRPAPPPVHDGDEGADGGQDIPKSFAPSQLGGTGSTPPAGTSPSGEDGGAAQSAAAKSDRSLLASRLPVPPKTATDRQLAFHNAATKTYERIFVDDLADLRAIDGLRGQLRSEAELRPVERVWGPLLDQAQARAQVLQSLQGPLGKLRAAFGQARFDEGLQVYRDVDMPSCRVAFKRAREEAPDALGVDVRVEPLGRRPFKDFEVICQEAHNIALMERDFPAPKGAPPIRNQIRKSYEAAFSGTHVLRIAVRGKGWDKGDSSRELRAVVGVKRDEFFPLDECAMEEIVMHQLKEGRKWGDVECCEVESSVAIACEAIE